jgi:hypothetical protein
MVTLKNFKLRGELLWRRWGVKSQSAISLFLPLSIPYFLGPLIMKVYVIVCGEMEKAMEI